MKPITIRGDLPNVFPREFRMKRMNLDDYNADLANSCDLLLYHIRGNVCDPKNAGKHRQNLQLCYGDVDWLRDKPIEEVEWLHTNAPAINYQEMIYLYEKRRNSS